MSALRVGRLFLLLASLAACGEHLVEFAIPGDAGAMTPDGGILLDAALGTADAVTSGDARGVADAPANGDARAPADAPLLADARAGGDAATSPGGDAGTTPMVDASTTGGDAGTTTGGDAATTSAADASTTNAGDAPIVDGDAGTVVAIDAGAGDGDAGTAGGDAGTDGPISLSPMVVATKPVDQAVGVAPGVIVTATFNEPMNAATIGDATFTVMQGTNPVAGVVSYDALTRTASFAPSVPLGIGLFTATITTGAQDLLGVGLASDFVWTFTTDACGQEPVALLSAGDFAVLAGSTVTNTGPTLVTGDVGVSPGTAVTGFPPGVIVGDLHAGDPTSAQGIADLTTAYDDVAHRTLCPVTVAGNLGGLTLAPGLYHSTSSLEISAGDLTLDAQGNPDAVFLFQMASTLTTTSGRMVILSGGAKAANVTWQVGTSATLGTNSVMVGTLLADQSITLETGATLDGRVLARIGAVALDSNTIVTP